MERERESAPRRISTLAFAGFELDAATEELRRDGRPVPLQPQPLKLLAHLAGRPGELVTRVELQKLLWGEFSEVDVEHGLNFCIAQIRAALGDAGGADGLVETLPRRGYRFRPPAPPLSPAAELRPVLLPVPAVRERQRRDAADSAELGAGCWRRWASSPSERWGRPSPRAGPPLPLLRRALRRRRPSVRPGRSGSRGTGWR